MKYIKFIGKFKDLIPDGWTFQKLFARNYRQYHKTCDGEKYSQKCRIWQHYGGYLEIDDFDTDIGVALIENINVRQFGKLNTSGFIWDNETKLLHPRGSGFFSDIKRKENEINPSELRQHLDRYRNIVVRHELLDMVQDLLNRKWIEIAEDHRLTN
jgi:hypothetical protein